MSTSPHPEIESDEIIAFHRNFGIIQCTLSMHVDDGSGHCAGCAWHDAPRPTWPCVHVYYADAAARSGGPTTAAATRTARVSADSSRRPRCAKCDHEREGHR